MRGLLFTVALALLACTRNPTPNESAGAPAVSPAAALTEEPLTPLPELLTVPAGAFPLLPGEKPEGSVSIGDTTHGRVVNARALSESKALAILPKQKARDLRYGADQLVGLLEHAAVKLHEATGTQLYVGNLGRKEGGDIEWSVSHNAGRDADVAFCYQHPVTKAPVTPPDLIALGKNGLSKDQRFAFDVARTWTVVRAMLEFEGASLQYLFISEPLKKKLLEHARATGVPPGLIDRASEILRQPGSAAPHDDHLHVRVYCSERDARGGCRDMGYTHTYAKLFGAERDAFAKKARVFASDPNPAVRRNALLRLGLIGAESDVELGLSRLADPSATVRVAAAELVSAHGAEKHVPDLARRYREEADPAVGKALIEAVGTLGGSDAGPFLRDLLLATAEAPSPGPVFGPSSFMYGGPVVEERLLFAPHPIPDGVLDRKGIARLAVQAARFADRIEPAEALVGLMDEGDPELSLLAAESLAFITNHRVIKTSDTRPPEERARAARKGYATLLSSVGPKAPRDAWLARGFSNAGYKVPAIDRRAIWEVVRAAADEEHLAYNARSVLARMLGQPRAVVFYGSGDGCRWLYGRVWERRTELGLPRPTEAQRDACQKARAREKSADDGLAVTAGPPAR